MLADIMRAKTKRVPCQICHGRGEMFKKQTEGVQTGRAIGETYMFRLLKEGKQVSRINVQVNVVMTSSGIPLMKINKTALFKRDKEIPRMYASITKVWPERDGVVDLIKFASGDPKIEWIEMDEYDARCYDFIQQLLDFGFVKEGTRFIKELTHEEGQQEVAAADDTKITGTDAAGGDAGGSVERNAGDSRP
jgi:hypothetical protein